VRRNLARVLLAPGEALHANVGRATAEASGSRIAPRREVRSDEDRGAFHRPAPVRTRGSLPLFIRAGLSSTQHLCPEEHRRFAERESLRLFNHPARPGMTRQASGVAQSSGTRGWLLPPPDTPRSQRPSNGFCDRRCPRTSSKLVVNRTPDGRSLLRASDPRCWGPPAGCPASGPLLPRRPPKAQRTQPLEPILFPK